jgi:hypothetical protein
MRQPTEPDSQVTVPLAETTNEIAPRCGDGRRCLQLDTYRGIALWFVYIDHIPNNIVSWLTMRNYGFSDATEIFVFISGYACTVSYGNAWRRDGYGVAVRLALRRSLEIYLAFLLLLASYLAVICLTGVDRYLDQTNTASFFRSPGHAALHALMLQFTPVNTDILPTFVLFHIAFPAVLLMLARCPWATLLGSFSLYLFVQFSGINFPSWPKGNWYFNPLAWQFLYIMGAWMADHSSRTVRKRSASSITVSLAVTVLVCSLIVVLGWRIPSLELLVPDGLTTLLYPIDKSTLDPLRLLHFLALAIVAQKIGAWSYTRTHLAWVRAAMCCGRHSLAVYCISVLLSFAAYVALNAITATPLAQVFVTSIGLATLIAFAQLLDRYVSRVGRAGIPL